MRTACSDACPYHPVMGRFDLVIFDCDGVLVDSERLIVKVEAQICKERGWALTEDDIVREFVGLSDLAMRTRLSELVGEELDEGWDAEYTDRYRNALALHLEVVAGVVAAIDAIEHAGLATCVASSGSHQKMALTLGKTGLLRRFEGRSSVPPTPRLSEASPPQTCFCMQRRVWASSLGGALWWRTARSGSWPRSMRAWCRSGLPAA